MGADFIFLWGWDRGDGSNLEGFPMERGIIIFWYLFFLRWGPEHMDGSMRSGGWGYFFGSLFSDLISVFVLGGKNIWVSAWG